MDPTSQCILDWGKDLVTRTGGIQISMLEKKSGTPNDTTGCKKGDSSKREQEASKKLLPKARPIQGEGHLRREESGQISNERGGCRHGGNGRAVQREKQSDGGALVKLG